MTIAETRRSQTGSVVPAGGHWRQAGARCRPEQASRTGLATSSWTWVGPLTPDRCPGSASSRSGDSVGPRAFLLRLRRDAERRRHERDVETLGICLGIFAIFGIVLTMQA